MDLKGKQLSLWAKILAIVFLLIVYCVLVFCKIDVPLSDAVTSAIGVATFIACAFIPVDASILTKNIKSRQKTVPDDGKGQKSEAVSTEVDNGRW